MELTHYVEKKLLGLIASCTIVLHTEKRNGDNVTVWYIHTSTACYSHEHLYWCVAMLWKYWGGGGGGPLHLLVKFIGRAGNVSLHNITV